MFFNFSPLIRFRALFQSAILSSIILFSFVAHAQTDLPRFIQYAESPNELLNLSTPNIYETVQDKDGFIWIASFDGLYRFDGYEFKKYEHKQSFADSISNNLVRTLHVDKHNDLWIGTEDGLNKYNSELDNFIRYNNKGLSDNKIWALYQDDKDNLWVATETALHKYDRDNDIFTTYTVVGFDKNVREIKSMAKDEQGNYWIGTFQKGLFFLNQTQLVSLAKPSSNYPYIPAQQIFDIKLISGKLWIATDLGVYVYHPQNKQVTTIAPTINNDSQALVVRSIEQLNDQNVLLGTERGLYNVNSTTMELSPVAKEFNNNDFKVFDIYKDSNNTVWVSTKDQGLLKHNPLNSIITRHYGADKEITIKADSMAELPSGEIWITNSDGFLYTLNPNHDIITRSNIKLRSPAIQIHKKDLNSLWVLTDDSELLICQVASGDCEPFANAPQQQISDSWNNLLFTDESIWIGSSRSRLYKFNIINNELTEFVPDGALGQNALINIHTKDADGNVYFSTAAGQLYSLKPGSQQATKINPPQFSEFFTSQINDVKVNGQDIWVASSNNGVLKISSDEVKIFNQSTGLSNNIVSSLLIDEKGRAWAGTNNGLNVIDKRNGTIETLDTLNGLHSNNFILLSALKTSTGRLLFGTTKGLNSSSADAINTQKLSFKAPVINELLVANKAIELNKKSKTQNSTQSSNQSILQTSIIDLSFNQSPFTFEFALPNAPIPEHVKYRYRLKGLDENWIDTNYSNRRATYTNLSSGLYTFEVQAYSKGMANYSPSKSIQVNIGAPWWKTKLAYASYGLVSLLVATYVLFQFRRKRQYHFQIKQSEERLKLALWGSGDEMWDWNIKTGKIYRSNIWGVLEFPQDGKRNVGAEKTNIHPHDIPRVKESIDEHFNNQTEVFEATYRVKDKYDNYIWVLDRGKIVERDSKQQPTRMTGTLKDISQIKKAEERLKLFAKCIENISDAVIIYDRQFTTVDVNKSFQRITGKKRSQVIGTTLRFSQYPDSFSQSIKKILINDGSWQGEVENKRENGEVYLIDITFDVIRDENGNVSHFVGVFSDITLRKQTEEELRKLANSDTLTGLPNRSYFHANLAQLVKSKTPLALLVFDLDNFKKINDSLGHQVGDALLCNVAERIINIGRRNDTVYRLGGDEFSIVVENTNDIHTITSIAKEILRTVAIPFKLKGQEIVLYSSIGIVLYPEDGNSPQELLKNADTAMYHAKDIGGNKYQFFSESMNKQAVKRLQIENLIRVGLKEDYFSVFYQPKIEIKSGKIAGMEALVRFETPKRGIISPGLFIPVSEETGQIIGIGETVLRKACYATKRWVDEGLFQGRLAVNLSAIQFTQPNLVKVISDILIESKLNPKYLELEITEGTVMDSPQEAIDTMHQIRSMGIHLSLDDFGTGYSSLTYLKKFPLNTLKIDKAFVDDIEHSEQGRNMVATIVTIAHNLELSVVAEGVETNAQLEFLATLGCEQLQGYLYSKPLASADFEKYLVSYKIADKSTSFTNL